MSRLHYNLVRTALDGAIDDTVTTFNITAPLREGGNLGSLIPTVSGDTLAIRVDDEIMHVTAYTSGSTTITTVARGQDDTVADSHADAAVVKHVIAKDDLASGGGVTAQESFVTSDVTIAAANTYYDGPSLSLGAGTYVLVGNVTVKSGASTWFAEAKLWDGTNVWHNPEHYSPAAGGTVTIAVSAVVTLTTTTTVKISAALNSLGGSGNVIMATAALNGTTNKASKLVAIQIA